ncbi:glycosyltransferase family 47 protein, partial [Hellea sp.]
RRDLLFSFVGAYEPELYLSPVRKWIFNLEHNKNWVIVSRGQWHFEDEVYGRQIGGKNLSEKNEQSLKNDAVYFSDVLSRSCFSLCPSGSGPNSIRFWESLGFGAIPVLLSDTLRLPGHHAEWNDAIIRIRETESDVLSLPAKLKALAKNEEKIYRMRVAGKALWKRYGLNGPKNLLGDLLSRETIAKLTLG